MGNVVPRDRCPLPVEEAGGHPMDQLDHVTVTDGLRRTAHHQLLSAKDSSKWDYTSHHAPVPQVSYLPGCFTIHQLLTSLKG